MLKGVHPSKLCVQQVPVFPDISN